MSPKLPLNSESSMLPAKNIFWNATLGSTQTEIYLKPSHHQGTYWREYSTAGTQFSTTYKNCTSVNTFLNSLSVYIIVAEDHELLWESQVILTQSILAYRDLTRSTSVVHAMRARPKRRLGPTFFIVKQHHEKFYFGNCTRFNTFKKKNNFSHKGHLTRLSSKTILPGV